jgi:hypothetical protein
LKATCEELAEGLRSLQARRTNVKRAPSGESQAAWLSGKPPEERISDVARGRNKPRETEEEQAVESGRNAEGGTKIGVGHRSNGGLLG